MGSADPRFRLEPATFQDIPQIRAIERSATAKFGEIPELSHLVEGDVLADSKIQSWLDKGRILIAKDSIAEDKPAGFIAVHPMDGQPYVAEVSVLSEYHRQGIGALLMNAAFDFARKEATSRNRSPRVTLTTYPDVPWNGPWYLKFGFKEIDAESLGPEHVRKMTTDREERDLVQPGYRRCCMVWRQ